MSFSSLRRLQKTLIQVKWIVVGKVIYSRSNYKIIKITEDSIEHEQLENDSVRKIEITALKKSQK